MDVIPILAFGGDAFNVLHKQFFVYAVELKALLFQFLNDFVPIVKIVEVKPFRNSTLRYGNPISLLHAIKGLRSTENNF